MSNMLADFFAKFTVQIDKSSIDKMQTSLGHGEQSMHKFGFAAEKLSGILGHLKLAFAGFVGFEGIKKTFEVNTTIDNTYNQLINATKSHKLAKDQLENVLEFANKSKMSMVGLAESFGPYANQLSMSGLNIEKQLNIFKKMQITYAGAHLTDFQQKLSNNDTLEFITGAIGIVRLKNMELGRYTALVQAMEHKLGAKSLHEADKVLKKMTPEQRADLISEVGYESYKDGQAAYEKGSMAALVNFKNQFTIIARSMEEEGFLKLSILVLDSLSSALSKLNGIVKFTGEIINVIIKSFKDSPIAMWSIIGVIGYLILFFNRLAFAQLQVAITGALAAAPYYLIGTAIVAVIAFIALLVDDINAYLNKGDSLIGRFLAKVEKYGHKIALWFHELFRDKIEKITGFGSKIAFWFDDIGTKITTSILSAFNSILDPIFEIFNKIKEKYISLVVKPVTEFGDKIEGFFGFKPEEKEKYTAKIPTVSQSVFDNLMPNVSHYTNFTTAPIIYPSSNYHNKNSSHVYSPQLTISVVANNGMNERDLASKISSHVETTLTSHYSRTLSDIAGT